MLCHNGMLQPKKISSRGLWEGESEGWGGSATDNQTFTPTLRHDSFFPLATHLHFKCGPVQPYEHLPGEICNTRLPTWSDSKGSETPQTNSYSWFT